MNHHGENRHEMQRGDTFAQLSDSPLPIKLKAIIADMEVLTEELKRILKSVEA